MILASGFQKINILKHVILTKQYQLDVICNLGMSVLKQKRKRNVVRMTECLFCFPKSFEDNLFYILPLWEACGLPCETIGSVNITSCNTKLLLELNLVGVHKELINSMFFQCDCYIHQPPFKYRIGALCCLTKINKHSRHLCNEISPVVVILMTNS